MTDQAMNATMQGHREILLPMTASISFLRSKAIQRALGRRDPRKQGFSLIELVVVVAVLAILAAIAIPAFTGLQDDAKKSAAKANLKQIANECAYTQARVDAGATGVTVEHKALVDVAGSIDYSTEAETAATCTGIASAAVTAGGTTTTYGINLATGEKPSGGSGAGSTTYTTW